MKTKRSTTLHDKLTKKVMEDPESRAAYEAFKLQLQIAAQLKKAREYAHLTQDNVAAIMATKKTVVSRLEAAGGKNKHSPSLITLVKYANAVGCHLQLKLIRGLR